MSERFRKGRNTFCDTSHLPGPDARSGCSVEKKKVDIYMTNGSGGETPKRMQILPRKPTV